MSLIDRPSWLYKNITTGATTVVKTGGGILHTLTVNKGVATGTISIYDALSATNPIGIITFGAALLGDPPITATYDVDFVTGLTIVTSGATDITVSYR